MVQKHELEKHDLAKEYEKLQRTIHQLQGENREERSAIEEDQWEKIDEVKEDNKTALAQMIEVGMDSKGQLTQVTGAYKSKLTKKDSYEKDSQEKLSKLNDLTTMTAELKQQIASSKKELTERNKTMEDKELRIYELKKKT